MRTNEAVISAAATMLPDSSAMRTRTEPGRIGSARYDVRWARRYPLPRTVSIDDRPKGVSILRRR
jgi:hypothetical protein